MERLNDYFQVVGGGNDDFDFYHCLKDISFVSKYADVVVKVGGKSGNEEGYITYTVTYVEFNEIEREEV